MGRIFSIWLGCFAFCFVDRHDIDYSYVCIVGIFKELWQHWHGHGGQTGTLVHAQYRTWHATLQEKALYGTCVHAEHYICNHVRHALSLLLCLCFC